MALMYLHTREKMNYYKNTYIGLAMFVKGFPLTVDNKTWFIQSSKIYKYRKNKNMSFLL